MFNRSSMSMVSPDITRLISGFILAESLLYLHFTHLYKYMMAGLLNKLIILYRRTFKIFIIYIVHGFICLNKTHYVYVEGYL